ncbi:MAG: hypothetical protein U0836_07640 [Pirellulales bacterium]
MWLLAVSVEEFVLPAVLGLVTFFLLQRSVRRFADLRKRRQEPRRLRIAPESNPPALANTPGEVELHERARELIARIDSKTATLEHLLRAAAIEAERLEEAIRRAESLAEKKPPAGP